MPTANPDIYGRAIATILIHERSSRGHQSLSNRIAFVALVFIKIRLIVLTIQFNWKIPVTKLLVPNQTARSRHGLTLLHTPFHAGGFYTKKFNERLLCGTWPFGL